MIAVVPSLEVVAWSHDYGRIDLTPWVTSCRTTKSLDSTTGDWSVTMRRRSGIEVLGVLKDDDWVTITSGGVPVMVGPIDTVRRTRSATQSGGVDVDHAIVGRDFARCFQSEGVFAPLLEGLKEPGVYDFRALNRIFEAKGQPTTDLIIGNTLVKPDEALRRLMSVVLSGDFLFWKLPTTLAPTDLYGVLRYLGEHPEGIVWHPDPYVSTRRTSIHEILSAPFRSPFTEFFYDLLDTKHHGQSHPGDFWTPPPLSAGTQWSRFVPTLVYRTIPFDAADWGRLPLHEVTADEVTADDLGTSGGDRYHVFAATMATFTQDGSVGVWGTSKGRVPAVAAKAAEIHGLRWLELDNPQMYPDQNSQARIIEDTARLWRWYWGMAESWSGGLTIARSRPEIRIGDRLSYEGRHYYIQQVGHSWDVGAGAGEVTETTTAQVVRGLPPGHRAPEIEPWDYPKPEVVYEPLPEAPIMFEEPFDTGLPPVVA